MKLLKTLFSISIVALLGCSQSGGGGGSANAPSNDWSSYSVKALSDLPGCSGTIVGRLYYVEDNSEFQVCKSTGWTVVNVQGNDGNDGSDGADGDDGMSLSSITSCFKASGGLYFRHEIVTFSDSSKWVKCSIGDTFTDYESSRFYKSTMNGAQNEGCILSYDSESPMTAGYWEFILASGTRTATYHDTGSTIDGAVMTFAPSDCTTN